VADPERIDYDSIKKHADGHYLSLDHLWTMWIRRNIVLVQPTGRWSVEDTAVYVNQYWSIFQDLRKRYDPVYFLFDMNHWQIQTEEFRRYIKESWSHVLERDDLYVLFVDANPMKRLIWSAMSQLIGKREQLLLFRDFAEAFAWLRGKKVRNGA